MWTTLLAVTIAVVETLEAITPQLAKLMAQWDKAPPEAAEQKAHRGS